MHMGMNDLLTVMQMQISGFYLLTVSGGDFDLTNLTRQSTSFIEYLKDAVRSLAHSKSTAFRQSIIQLRIAWTHLGPIKLGFPISWFIKLLFFSVQKTVQLKTAMTFCARKIPWIVGSFGDRCTIGRTMWGCWRAFLSNMRRSSCSLPAVWVRPELRKCDVRLQWVAAIHPWAVGW